MKRASASAVYLDPSVQAPIIVTFRSARGSALSISRPSIAALAARGFIIYPGKLTRAQSFRIGCIGALKPEDFQRLIEAVSEVTAPLPSTGA